MNILHIMKDYKPNTGGSVVRNSSMLETYRSKFDDNLYILNLDGNCYEFYSLLENIEVYRCKSLKEMVVLAVKLIRKKNINVIHGHNFRFMFVSFLSNWLAGKRCSVIVEIHALYHMSVIKEKLSYFLLKRADKIIVLAESAKQYLVKEHKLSPKKITAIRNGISFSKEILPDECELTKKVDKLHRCNCIAAYTGSFFEWQGVIFLARNMDRLLETDKNLIILMVGDGPQFEEAKEIIEHSKYRNRIILERGITKAQMKTLIKNIDIVLIPRQKNLSTNTAVPLKVIEAMMEEKCILAADDDGLREVLNNSNAQIFQAENINDMEKKLKELLGNETLRRGLGKNARETAQHSLVSWEDNVLLMHKIYEKI